MHQSFAENGLFNRLLGISIWESEKTDHAKRLAAVAKFVEGVGDQMDYTVAADDNDGSMAKDWMEAAEENGIPTAFIVGRDGRVAWIGYPWSGLNERIEQTVAGTLDKNAIQAEAAKRQQEKAAEARQGELLKPVNELQKRGKPAEAIASLDKLVAEHPEQAAKTEFFRYKLLLAYDEPAAYKQVCKLLEGELKDNPSALYMLGRDLTDPPGRKTPDWDLALAVTQRACELMKYSDPSTLSTLAEAYHGKGDQSKAIETGELAVEKADADSIYPAGSTKYLKPRLQVFKTAQQTDAQKKPER